MKNLLVKIYNFKYLFIATLLLTINNIYAETPNPTISKDTKTVDLEKIVIQKSTRELNSNKELNNSGPVGMIGAIVDAVVKNPVAVAVGEAVSETVGGPLEITSAVAEIAKSVLDKKNFNKIIAKKLQKKIIDFLHSLGVKNGVDNNRKKALKFLGPAAIVLEFAPDIFNMVTSFFSNNSDGFGKAYSGLVKTATIYGATMLFEAVMSANFMAPIAGAIAIAIPAGLPMIAVGVVGGIVAPLIIANYVWKYGGIDEKLLSDGKGIFKSGHEAIDNLQKDIKSRVDNFIKSISGTNLTGNAGSAGNSDGLPDLKPQNQTKQDTVKMQELKVH